MSKKIYGKQKLNLTLTLLQTEPPEPLLNSSASQALDRRIFSQEAIQ